MSSGSGKSEIPAWYKFGTECEAHGYSLVWTTASEAKKRRGTVSGQTKLTAVRLSKKKARELVGSTACVNREQVLPRFG